ncbi:MAG: hypothetical protein FWE17_01290 [Alphaproteobacteria bacterium]|nr:hypothetical protein [Alphaproteobacteria bacterium]
MSRTCRPGNCEAIVRDGTYAMKSGLRLLFFALALVFASAAHSACEPGCRPIGLTCQPCPAGTFASAGSLSCTPCPSGQIGNRATGATHCVNFRTLRTSAGHSAILRSTKNTSPSLAIRDGDTVYWGDLSTVLVSGSFRINYNDTIYSVVEPTKTADACGVLTAGEFRVTLNNMPANSQFSLQISAAGNFTIDWGNGAPETNINKTNTTVTTYTSPTTHRYNGGPFTVTIRGRATSYSSAATAAAISFASSMNRNNIVAIEGDLGGIFPILNATATGSPRFRSTFSSAAGLASPIPENLFAGVQGRPVSNMFHFTFAESAVTGSIPENLFAGIVGPPAPEMFRATFNLCPGLTGPIPGNLFAGISGAPAEMMFRYTFSSSPGLTSIGTGLFDGISGTAQNEMFLGTFQNVTGLRGPAARLSNGQLLYQRWPNATVAQVGQAFRAATGLDNFNSIPVNWR